MTKAIKRLLVPSLLLGFAALPVQAQSSYDGDQDGWYAHHSTPAEQAETRDLNRQASHGNGAADQVPDPASDAAAAQYRRQQAYYQREQNAYAAQRRDYAAQMENYAAVRDRYRAERAAYRRHHWRGRYQNWIPDGSADLGGWAVRTDDGAPIGTVSAIARTPEGHFEALRVALGNGGVTWIDASDLRFDRYRRTAFTDLDPDDLHRMTAERY